MHRAILLVFAAAAACGNADRSTPPAPPPLASATAADLARDLADADRLGTWSGLAGRWQGQRVRWAVTRHGLLCASADDCHVAAFPIQRPAQHGWMPELVFAPGQYDALARLCAGHEPCELTVEATLSKLAASPELPASVRLSDVHVVTGARRA